MSAAVVASSQAVPPFSLTKPRYDLSSYTGRLQYFLELTDPRFLIYTNKHIEKAHEVLEGYRRTGLICESEEYMWLQRRIYESAVHPVTKDIINPLFRVSAIAPVNIPIVFLMLTCPASNIAGTLSLHFINQSYNSACNYANRSGESLPITQTLGAYSLAVTSACVFAYGLGKVKALQRYGFAIPLLATSVANVSNIGFTRVNELLEGASIYDKDGNELGRSKVAGAIGVAQTTVTRCLAVPCACLLLPPLFMAGYRRLLSSVRVTASPRASVLIELVAIYASIQAALPAALAVFPQTYTLRSAFLEPQFRSMKTKEGNLIENVYGNKGL